MANYLSLTATCFLIAVTLASNAQHIRETRSVIIDNGDTVINGKNIKNVSPAERSRLRKELEANKTEADFQQRRQTHEKRGIHRLPGDDITITDPDDGPGVFGWDDHHSGTFSFRTPKGDARVFTYKPDSIFIAMKIDSVLKTMDFKFDDLDSGIHNRIIVSNTNEFKGPGIRVFRNRDFDGDMFSGGRNTQNFSYRNTDKDGITTKVNISVSDVSKEQWKQITGQPGQEQTLEIQNLNLSPDFSSNKLNVSFISDSKGSTTVKLLNTDYKVLFAHTSNFIGNYFKQVNLPRNGIYYLAIKQGNKWYIRKFIKD